MVAISKTLAFLGLLSAAERAAAHAGSHGANRKQHGLMRRGASDAVELDKRGTTYSGIATFYEAETGQAGACGWYIKDSDYSVALKVDMYGNTGVASWWCGQSITITGNGKTATAIIADACPGCQGAAGLDMTPGLFSYFISEDAGVMDITWHLATDGGATSSSKYVVPTTSSVWVAPTTHWTPSTTQWTPSSTYVAPTSTWTPEYTPSTSSKHSTTSHSHTSSQPHTSLTSSAISSSVAVLNTTATASVLNATVSLTNSTASANVTSTAADATATAKKGKVAISSGSDNGDSGNLGSVHQIVIDIAGLAYAAAEHSS